jgi:hypothetical protein
MSLRELPKRCERGFRRWLERRTAAGQYTEGESDDFERLEREVWTESSEMQPPLHRPKKTP